MSRFLSLAIGTGLLISVGPVAVPSPVAAAANENIATCRSLIQEPEFSSLSLGECVSVLTVEDNYYGKGTGALHGAAVLECNLMAQYDPDYYASFGSKAACVDYLETILAF